MVTLDSPVWSPNLIWAIFFVTSYFLITLYYGHI
nr:MAG TPA: Sporulation protein YpjB (SpoYpjB) [Caudoviricetes sp.]